MRRSDIARERAFTPVAPRGAPPPLPMPAETGNTSVQRNNGDALFFKAPDNPVKKPKDVAGIVFDFSPLSRSFLANLNDAGEPQSPLPPRTLLPANFAWTTSQGEQRIPMMLSEFCAYRAALAYADESIIKSSVSDGTPLAFFDTKGNVTDTQGFGFLYDGMVFIAMRGTQEKADWRVNISDNLTDEIDINDERLIANLVKRFATDEEKTGDAAAKHDAAFRSLVGDLKSCRGMHLGFALAWAEVLPQITKFISQFDPVPPIVLTGHSLGGALATVGACNLRQSGFPVAAVVTFGAPCVGNDVFAEDYRNSAVGGYSLGERTVRFVSDGDSVPKIMRRWYYQIARDLKQALRSFGRPPVEKLSNDFDDVGSRLTFAGSPMDSLDSVKRAIEEYQKRQAEAEKKAKAEEAAKQAKKQETAPSAGANGSSAKAADTGQPTSSANPNSSAAAGPTADGSPAKDATGGGAGWVILIPFLVIGAVFVAIFGFIFVSSKLASHSMSKRYALFLSTLSYQKIRSFFAGEPGTRAERLEAANLDLKRYVRFIRGDHRRPNFYTSPASEGVGELPVALSADLDLATFTSINKDANVI